MYYCKSRNFCVRFIFVQNFVREKSYKNYIFVNILFWYNSLAFAPQGWTTIADNVIWQWIMEIITFSKKKSIKSKYAQILHWLSFDDSENKAKNADNDLEMKILPKLTDMKIFLFYSNLLPYIYTPVNMIFKMFHWCQYIEPMHHWIIVYMMLVVHLSNLCRSLDYLHSSVPKMTILQ